MITALVSCPEEEIPNILSELKHWPFDKVSHTTHSNHQHVMIATLINYNTQDDLLHWVEVLNRLDSILEHLDESYKANSLGFPEPSASFNKDLVLQILNFTTQLLNNCSNVKYYNSVEVIIVFFVLYCVLIVLFYSVVAGCGESL